MLNTELLCSATSISMKVDSSYKDQSDSVYYNILLLVDSAQFSSSRRFNQFHEFDKILKYHFPDVTFPVLPSKFTIFNKIELRKKGFSQYLEDLVSLAKLFNNDQKVMFMKLLVEFLNEDAGVNLQKSTRISLNESMVSGSSYDYQGWSMVKVLENWEKYYIYIKGASIYLHKSMESEVFQYAILLVSFKFVSNKNILELHLDNQDQPIFLTSSDEKSLKELKEKLTIVISSNTNSHLTSHRLKSVGRLFLTIHSAQNIKYVKPPASLIKPYVYISIEIGELSVKSSIIQIGEELVWNQTFIMPIFNVFFDLKLSLCVVTSEGWIKQHAKTEVLHSVKIPITDINQQPFNKGTVVVPFSEAKGKNNEDLANIVLDISKKASFSSNFVSTPSHYIEDTLLPQQASMHELKIAFRRMKRIRILYMKLAKSVFQIIYWIYPEFSKLCLITFSVFVLFVPSNLFLPFVLFLILLTLLYFSPDLKPYSKRFKKRFFSKKKHIEPYPKVITIKEAVHLKKSEMKIMKEKVNEGVIKRWKKFKEDAVELQNYLIIIACYGEKIRNLFLWEDPEKSLYFAFGLVTALFFFILIPFRAILFFAGVHRFYKGYRYTKKRIENNRKVSEETLNFLLQDLIPERMLRSTSTDPWPKDIKENQNIQKKFIEGLRTILNLEIDQFLFDKYPTPLDLSKYIGSAHILLKPKNIKFKNLHNFDSGNSDNFLLSFLANVPSEYYRLEHPRLANVESYY